MLSILIPIYNYDVRSLVRTLLTQCRGLNIEFEIFCLDDASMNEYQVLNQELKNFIRYEELDHNIGRSAIRNLLAERARYEYLLYMDCDTMPEQHSFVQNYVAHLQENFVLYGGLSYASRIEKDSVYYLHWYYGSQREVSYVQDRKLAPYQSFKTSNFVIPKSVLLDIRFDETLKQYGHEDTLFGLELRNRAIPILHLNNPMRHIGLETTTVFLRKSEQAVENLLLLRKKHPSLEKEIKLLNFFEKTRRWGLHPFIAYWFKINKKRLQKKFTSSKINLRSFDLYRLGYMVNLFRHKK